LDFHAALDFIESGRTRTGLAPRSRRYLLVEPPPARRAPPGIPEGTVLAAFDSLELMLQFVREHAGTGRPLQVFDTHHGREVPVEYLLPR
jgi:hypothetical protein